MLADFEKTFHKLTNSGVLKVLGRRADGTETLVQVFPTGYQEIEDTGSFVRSIILGPLKDDGEADGMFERKMHARVVITHPVTERVKQTHFEAKTFIPQFETADMYEAQLRDEDVDQWVKDFFKEDSDAWIFRPWDDAHLAFARDEKLRSIRDLRGEHLEMLCEMRKVIHKAFPGDNIVVYAHYPPSQWRLHMHIKPFDKVRGTEWPRVRYLDEIIDNIQRDANHYKVCGMNICRVRLT
jgi:hypothetical protein